MFGELLWLVVIIMVILVVLGLSCSAANSVKRTGQAIGEWNEEKLSKRQRRRELERELRNL